MKTKNLEDLINYKGTILIPVFETNEKSLVPIEFHGVSIASKVFYGKKDTQYLVEKYDCLHVFIGLGKELANTAGKIINSLKVELEYNQILSLKQEIDFLKNKQKQITP